MKTIKLSITEDYVSHWSWWEGTRELIQNAIDTGDYEVNFLDEENAITIVSRGGKVPNNALLLGKSSKKGDNTKIGKFGEGMKLGFLVLLREGAEVFMHNHDEFWEPALVYDPEFDAKILEVEISEYGRRGRTEEVTIVIKNIPADAMKEIKSNYAPTSGAEVVIENASGKAYKKAGVNNKTCNIFVNGLYVTTLTSGKYKFDYDFKPSVITLDRDRDSVGEFEVKYHACRILEGSDDIELLATLMLESYDDLAYFNGRRKIPSGSSYGGYYSSGEDEDLNDKAITLFYEKYGDNAYPLNNNWTDGKKRIVGQAAVSKGYLPTTVSENVYKLIQKEFAVDDQLEEMLSFKPLNFLEKFLEKHGRNLYSKARKELQKAIETLRIAEGKE